jgi:ferrous iron transport protein B
MGIHQDNWPAVVGLITGIISKEVILGTLITLYEQEQNPNTLALLEEPTLHKINSKILGTMSLRFQSAIAAFAYLLFILLYCPCVSVVVIITRELGWRWALFAMGWTTGLAYILAVACYQIFTRHNLMASICWLVGLVAIFTGCTYLIKLVLYKKEKAVTVFPRLIPTKIT